MATKPVFTKQPTSYDSGNAYMDVVNELLKKNRGGRFLNLYDTGSNTPSVLPEAAGIRSASIANGTNVGSDMGESSYIPNAIQSTRTNTNQTPQSQGTQSANTRPETTQESIDRALRMGQDMQSQGVDEEQQFNDYIQQNGTVSPTGPSEQDYINYFLDSRQITDPSSRNMISILLSTPSKSETEAIQNYVMPDTQRDINLSQAKSQNTDLFTQWVAETDPAKKEELGKQLASATAKLGSEAPGTQPGTTTDYAWMDQKDKEAADARQAAGLAELNKPDTQVNPIRQFLGNAVDVLGTTFGAGESNLSEQIAGGPTINTGKKVKKNIGDFIPQMPSLVRDVQAAEHIPGQLQQQTKITPKAPQKNIFSDLVKGAQDLGTNALSAAGQGVSALKDTVGNLFDENILKKQDLSKMGAKNAVGEDSAQTSMESMPGFAKSTPFSNNQDAFFKAGGAQQYKDFLSPRVDQNYRGALNTNLFNDKFYENPDNVANVFGSTSQGGEATGKYKSYMEKQYPIIPGHDSPTVRKVATGKYEDGSEWRVEYDDVDPVYYDNQYNKSVLSSIPAVLTSSFKYTAPRSGGKQVAGASGPPSGVFEPVKGDKTVPGTNGFSVPAQASNIRTQSLPAGTSNVFSVAAQQKTPYATSGYSVPTKSNSPSSSGYSAPQQSRPSSSQPSRPNPTPAPAPSRPSTPAPSAPQQTQSKPNAWSNPAPSYAAPQKSSPAPAPKPQSQNVFTNLVNTIKSWF